MGSAAVSELATFKGVQEKSEISAPIINNAEKH